MAEKPKCPLRNFQPCIKKECAFFVSEYSSKPFVSKIGKKEVDIKLQAHIVTPNQCAIPLIGLAGFEFFSQIFTKKVLDESLTQLDEYLKG